MLGALAGDIIGSRFEWHNNRSKEFELFNDESFFTDDSVLTVATAECLLTGEAYTVAYRLWGRRWPDAGYGTRFQGWLADPSRGPYNSCGNGAAMRVRTAGFAATTLEEALQLAEASAVVTHNHPEGVKGAQATAAAIFLARTGSGKEAIRRYCEETFRYRLDRTLDEIRPGYQFDETCQKTVPEALTAFFEATDFEDAIRGAISLGGDSDTLACITGGIAQAAFGIPGWIRQETEKRLHPDMVRVVRAFEERYMDAPRA